MHLVARAHIVSGRSFVGVDTERDVQLAGSLAWLGLPAVTGGKCGVEARSGGVI
jgi:hypothetical protein